MQRPGIIRSVHSFTLERLLRLGAVICLAIPVGRPLSAQDRGAAALAELVQGLGVTARVLVIGAHPDDEDTRLIAWLQRGRHVETAYLSLTRGDGGQNLIGNELGEALGVIRTEELLAARRTDGAQQYFTRAYDFGFSKSAEETFKHWPKDSVLGDVVKVVRAFRPHVIVSVFSGTPSDGHGQHQVSGILAREVYDMAGDSVRFPEASHGYPWTPLKFYRSTSFRGENATLTYNAGEYSPLLGRSYAEIGGESRSQHKSQAFGVLQRKGVVLGSARREASRVNQGTEPKAEKSIFDGIDTTISRLRPSTRCAAFDSIAPSIAAAQRALDLFHPGRSVPALARLHRVTGKAVNLTVRGDEEQACTSLDDDAWTSISTIRSRAEEALRLALGVVVEATVQRGYVARDEGAAIPVTVTVYNRGDRPIRVPPLLSGWSRAFLHPFTLVEPDSTLQFVDSVPSRSFTQPWWLAQPRNGDLFAPAIPPWPANVDALAARATVLVVLHDEGTSIHVMVPVVNRFADPIRGEIQRPVAVVPAVSVNLDKRVELMGAHATSDRRLNVQLRSADSASREVTLTLDLPAGLTADSASRTITLPNYGATRTVAFRLRGKLPVGVHAVHAVATSKGQTFSDGYTSIEYDHIRPQNIYRDATVILQSVDVKLPPRVNVAYVPGVGDNSAPVLQQLGLPVTLLDPAVLGTTDLSRYTTIVIGPRAYESSEALVTNNARLLDYVKDGGTLVVQYGQYEMTRPGIMPYPITINRPHDRVTDENAPVRVLGTGHRLLTTPNRITAQDFEGWIQERSLYMPRTFAEQYEPLLSLNDPGEAANNGAILVASYGKGTYVYTTLAFFRQLPAGVPGAVRLFVNLLGAGNNGRSGVRASQ
ncbi:MAG: PIG-L family deacetylase [Gemmatimonadaceae bacterium]